MLTSRLYYFIRAELLGLSDYWESLRRLDFDYTNPLLWTLAFLAMLILSLKWKIKKAFSYCVNVTVILMLSSQAEKFIAGWLARAGESYDLTIIKVLAFLVIIFVTAAYYFVES